MIGWISTHAYVVKCFTHLCLTSPFGIRKIYSDYRNMSVNRENLFKHILWIGLQCSQQSDNQYNTTDPKDQNQK
jgi:hypothetical protein